MNIIIFVILVILVKIFFIRPSINFSPYEIKGYTDINENSFSYTPGDIPKIIFKTSFHERNKIPLQMIEAFEITKQLNPEYEIYYFDHSEREQFMKDFSEDVYSCYKKIIPGAFQADLFRICALYRYGGCYSDIGHIMKQSFNKIVEDANIVLVSDFISIPNTFLKGPYFGIHNALMCSVKGHPFFKELINKICENVTNEYYGETELDVTGPTIIGKVFNCYFESVCDYKNKNLTVIGNKNYGCDYCKVKMLNLAFYPLKLKISSFIIDTDGKDVAQTKFDNYYHVMYSSRKTPGYKKLWNMKKIYK